MGRDAVAQGAPVHDAQMIHSFLGKTASQVAVVIALLGLPIQSAAAAAHYVRRGATGANTGADWTNAYTQLPATLVRGDTYYLADGTGYSGDGLGTDVSGTTYIYVKKCPSSAIMTDPCQSVAGWSDNYGTGQAVFDPIQIDASSGHPGYVELDGQHEYGIRISFPDALNVHGVWLNMGSPSNGAPQFHFRFIELVGPGGSTPYPYQYSGCGIFEGGYPGDISGLSVAHCSFHGMQTPVELVGPGVHDVLIERNDFYDVLASSAVHTNVLWLGPMHDVTIRYNRSHHYDTEGFFLTGYQGGSTSTYYNIYIYGNVFYDGYSPTGQNYPRGIEIRSDYTYGAIYIYNNTCADMNLACVNNSSGLTGAGDGVTGGEVRDNLGYGPNSGFGVGTMLSSNSLTTSDSSVFIDYAARDFHLSGPTAAGYVLPAPYDVDMDGQRRGADGTWDVGAYEYCVGAACTTTTPGDAGAPADGAPEDGAPVGGGATPSTAASCGCRTPGQAGPGLLALAAILVGMRRRRRSG
jgi:MYXO-CTERM domain-containing protein